MFDRNAQNRGLAVFDNVRVGLLEDDAVVAGAIEVVFERNAWQFAHYKTVADISAAVHERSFDVLLLDWSLPDGKADRVIRLVRDQLGLDTPIMIESVNGDEQHIVECLLLGADDYVVKPLRLSELEARIKALLRRRKLDELQPMSTGPYRIDLDNHVLYLNDEALDLTDTEFRLASHFLEHPNELLSRQQLLVDVWNSNPEIDTRTVDMHISRLRKKLRFGVDTGITINSLRGYGYRLESAT